MNSMGSENFAHRICMLYCFRPACFDGVQGYGPVAGLVSLTVEMWLTRPPRTALPTIQWEAVARQRCAVRRGSGIRARRTFSFSVSEKLHDGTSA